MNTQPFSNNPAQLKVLDLGTQIAAPFAATLLGDFGAEVIKCEQPGTGDPVRIDSGRWLLDSRNKRSITLNLRVAEGQEILRRLAAWADVLVENFRPGTMKKWGIGYEDLAKINPRLVYVAISGFGQTGPYASLPGYDFIGSAFGGMTALTGYPDLPPVIPGLFVVDHTSGVFGALGALEAVRRRDAAGGTGRGAFIDLALYETALRYAGTDLVDYSLRGYLRTRTGGMPSESAQQEAPLWFAYETKDRRWLSVVTVMPTQIQGLRTLVSDRRLLDKKFDSLVSTMSHAAEFYDIVNTWIGQRDFNEVWEALNKAGIPAGPINTAQDIINDPHITARGSVLSEKSVDGKAVVMPAVTPRLDNEVHNIRWIGEPLGASNHQVYSSVLGFSENDIAGLRTRGVI
jgi:crotonobetainyl-CoA:carnitine CoA-transferase CaiB-like acyl-CoA transferase